MLLINWCFYLIFMLRLRLALIPVSSPPYLICSLITSGTCSEGTKIFLVHFDEHTIPHSLSYLTLAFDDSLAELLAVFHTRIPLLFLSLGGQPLVP